MRGVGPSTLITWVTAVRPLRIMSSQMVDQLIFVICHIPSMPPMITVEVMYTLVISVRFFTVVAPSELIPIYINNNSKEQQDIVLLLLILYLYLPIDYHPALQFSLPISFISPLKGICYLISPKIAVPHHGIPHD